MKEVAKQTGIKVIDYPNQGQRTQWIQGIQQAIARKVDAIVVSGGTIGPIYFKEQAAAAERAGIPIITVVDRDLTQDAEPNTAARVGQPYAEAARLDADWIIKQTKCKANVLVLTTNELIAGDINSEAAKDEFAKYCGDGLQDEVRQRPALTMGDEDPDHRADRGVVEPEPELRVPAL